MKRILMVLVVVSLVAALSAVPVLAKGPNGPSGKSVVGHLYLFEKDPATWEVVDEGSWGKLSYMCGDDGLSFVFNGHMLEPGAAYELMNYVDPWPGTGSALLASGVVNEEGDLHVSGSISCLEVAEGFDGAKIWLVLADDFDEAGGTMVGWNPTEYLFEDALTMCCACPPAE